MLGHRHHRSTVRRPGHGTFAAGASGNPTTRFCRFKRTTLSAPMARIRLGPAARRAHPQPRGRDGQTHQGTMRSRRLASITAPYTTALPIFCLRSSRPRDQAIEGLRSIGNRSTLTATPAEGNPSFMTRQSPSRAFGVAANSHRPRMRVGARPIVPAFFVAFHHIISPERFGGASMAGKPGMNAGQCFRHVATPRRPRHRRASSVPSCAAACWLR